MALHSHGVAGFDVCTFVRRITSYAMRKEWKRRIAIESAAQKSAWYPALYEEIDTTMPINVRIKTAKETK